MEKNWGGGLNNLIGRTVKSVVEEMDQSPEVKLVVKYCEIWQ